MSQCVYCLKRHFRLIPARTDGLGSRKLTLQRDTETLRKALQCSFPTFQDRRNLRKFKSTVGTVLTAFLVSAKLSSTCLFVQNCQPNRLPQSCNRSVRLTAGYFCRNVFDPNKQMPNCHLKLHSTVANFHERNACVLLWRRASQPKSSRYANVLDIVAWFSVIWLNIQYCDNSTENIFLARISSFVS